MPDQKPEFQAAKDCDDVAVSGVLKFRVPDHEFAMNFGATNKNLKCNFYMDGSGSPPL